MLPMPGSPSFSWAMFRQRVQTYLGGVEWNVAIAFWLFGLINNILYVILLTAALDLVGPDIPKGTVLLADVIPSLFVKATAPYYIHVVPYNTRVCLLSAISACGMLLVGYSSTARDATGITIKMVGIILASLSSGGGELSFLGLTHYYGTSSLAAWGSGTGGAGLIGAGAYAFLTTTFGISVRNTLLASAFLPLIMLLSFFVILPQGPLKAAQHTSTAYQSIPDEEAEDQPDSVHSSTGLLVQRGERSVSPAYNNHHRSSFQSALHSLTTKLRRAQSLVIPYMLPLFLVYVAEYTINQGVAPTLLFPLTQTPFKHFRAFYPAYGAIYQAGVFVSRSSLPFLRIRTLYTPAILQVLNLIGLTVHAMYPFVPSVWFVFAIVFWEGLLGGLVYVSTFAAIREEVEEGEREFSLGATTVSDSAGICLAGFVSIGMEKALCGWQVQHGREWCRKL